MLLKHSTTNAVKLGAERIHGSAYISLQ